MTNKTEYRQIGRITGKKVGELYFRVPYDYRICIGDLALAEDEHDLGIHYYLRVVDISYGAEGADTGWFERTAGNLMLADMAGREETLFEKERRLYKIARCSLLGYLRSDKFYKPKTMPDHFARVRVPVSDDFRFLRGAHGDLEFARLRSGEDILDLPLGIPGVTVSSHIGLFATTGMGKSNLMKRFAGAILASGNIGLLIFDPHGEYYDGGGEDQNRGLIHHPDARENLKIFSSRKRDGNISYDMLKISAYEIIPSDLSHIYEFSEAQEEALYALYFKYRDEWLVKLDEKDISELAGKITTHGGFAESTLGVLKRRAEYLLKQKFIHTDRKVSTSENIIKKLRFGKVVLVDSSSLTSRDELLVSSVICRNLFGEYRDLYAHPDQFRKTPRVLVVLEEAQRVLRKSGKKTNIFSRLAREGRKFKLGICAITQQPKLIDEELLSQFNTFFILGLADESDRQIIRSSSKQDISDLGTEIQMLAPGEALITSPVVPFALPVKIDLYEDYLDSMAESKNGTSLKSRTTVDTDFFD